METSNELILDITSNWAETHSEFAELVPNVHTTEDQLLEILTANKSLIEAWARRVIADEHDNAHERIKSAIIELLLWYLFKKCQDADSKRELLGALWKQVEKIIKRCAASLVHNLPSQNRRQDAVEQYMQEGFLQFEEALERYDPSKKQTMLRSFIGTFYRSRMINIANSKVMKARDTEPLSEAEQPVDDFDTEFRFNQEQLGEIEVALMQIESQDERDAERVTAFRMFMIEGKDNADVASSLGRSTSWVTKAHQRIRELLREMLLQ